MSEYQGKAPPRHIAVLPKEPCRIQLETKILIEGPSPTQQCTRQEHTSPHPFHPRDPIRYTHPKKLKLLSHVQNLKVNLRILLRELCLYFLQQSFNRFFWKAVRSGKTHPDSGQSDRLTFWILILGT